MRAAPDMVTPEFRALSARLGRDPMQVQGPGGNMSVKGDGIMWIKASGTELGQAESRAIFVAVDRNAALAEALGEAGDGSCGTTVIDPANKLRPSIETTFHAALECRVVVHTHSVATLVHAISPEGLAALPEKLEGMPIALVPYAKPGLPLTRGIIEKGRPETRIYILQNHGLICCGASVDEVSDLVSETEERLRMPVLTDMTRKPVGEPDDGFEWAAESWLAFNPLARDRATAGTYYPDHVVFLGPALQSRDSAGTRPVVLCPDRGVLIRVDATPSQRTMLRCISDVLSRLPPDWTATAIGAKAEAELVNWDAEKYRLALANR